MDFFFCFHVIKWVGDFMDNLYKSMGAIVGFLIIEIIIATLFDSKTAEKMALFILLGMVLINSNSIISFLEKF